MLTNISLSMRELAAVLEHGRVPESQARGCGPEPRVVDEVQGDLRTASTGPRELRPTRVVRGHDFTLHHQMLSATHDTSHRRDSAAHPPHPTGHRRTDR